MGYSLTSLTTASTTGASGALSVSWRSGKPWSALLTTSAASTGDVTVQYTLQDITSSNISTVIPSWNNFTALNGATGVSSAITSSGGYLSIHIESSTIDTAAGMLLWGSYPIAGIRLNSTANNGVLVLTLLQGDGW